MQMFAPGEQPSFQKLGEVLLSTRVSKVFFTPLSGSEPAQYPSESIFSHARFFDPKENPP
jgi:hypothetical protein